MEPNFKVEVKSKASGEVLKFPFEEGDRIKKGTLLLQLDKSDEQRNVAKAMAEKSSSVAKLRKAQTALLLQDTKYETDLQKAKSAVEAAQSQLDGVRRKAETAEESFRARVCGEGDSGRGGNLFQGQERKPDSISGSIAGGERFHP